MPVYKVVEVGSGGGGGCLVTAVLIALGLFALADACDSSSPQTSSNTSVEETPTPSLSDRSTPQSESAPNTKQSEQTLRQKFINNWALQRLREEDGPVVLVAIAGAGSFRTGLARELRRQGVNAQSGVLNKAAYESKSILRRLGSGNRKLLRRLGLTQLSGHLILGRLSIREPDPGELYKARAQLSVSVSPIGSSAQPRQRSFETRGGGFEQAEARQQALKRLENAFLTSSIADRLPRRP